MQLRNIGLEEMPLRSFIKVAAVRRVFERIQRYANRKFGVGIQTTQFLLSGRFLVYRRIHQVRRNFFATGRTYDGLNYLAERGWLERSSSWLAIERARVLISLGNIKLALSELEAAGEKVAVLAERAQIWLYCTVR